MVRRLKHFIKYFRYGEKGFTLIELLVVIAILGVLAAVAVPNVSKFIGSGQISALNAEAAAINTAIAAYQSDNGGNNPADTAALAPYLKNQLVATYTLNAGSIASGSYINGSITYTYSTTTGKFTKSP